MIITKRLFFVLVKGGVCCLRFDPFSTLAWRQRYVKDFIACKKLPFLLALRRWDVSRGPSSARNVPCGERTSRKWLFSQAKEWSEKYSLSRNRDGLKQNEFADGSSAVFNSTTNRYMLILWRK